MYILVCETPTTKERGTSSNIEMRTHDDGDCDGGRQGRGPLPAANSRSPCTMQPEHRNTRNTYDRYFLSLSKFLDPEYHESHLP